jgi:hypothetical protein
VAGRAFTLTAPVSSPHPRLKFKAPPVAEEDLQAAVCKALAMLLKPPAMWWAMPIGHVQLSPAQAARLSRIGLKRGLPDLMLLHGGRLFGIELKRERGGRLSQTRTVRTRSGALRELVGQADVFPRLEAAGMTIAVCSSVADVLAECRAWGLPLRGHC